MILTWIYVYSTIASYTAIGGIDKFIDRITKFTVQSNILVALWFTYAVIYFLKNNGFKQKISYPFLAKGAVSVYIVITMLVYAFFLAPLIDYKEHNTLLMIRHWYSHFIVPPIFILDLFLIDIKKPGKWFYPLLWLVYPVLYLVYILILGYSIDYFPYYFLNPVEMGTRFIISVVMLFLAFIGIGYTILFLRNLKYRHHIKNKAYSTSTEA